MVLLSDGVQLYGHLQHPRVVVQLDCIPALPLNNVDENCIRVADSKGWELHQKDKCTFVVLPKRDRRWALLITKQYYGEARDCYTLGDYHGVLAWIAECSHILYSLTYSTYINPITRPIAALAISPGLKVPPAPLTCMSWLIEPFIIQNGLYEPVLVVYMSEQVFGSIKSCTPAIDTGMWIGRAPAIIALMAIFSTVAFPNRCLILPTTWSAGRSVPVSISLTASLVGGFIGKPSTHPLL